MRILVLTTACCMILLGCGLPVATVHQEFGRDDDFTLYSIRINRWNTLRFSGLLALQKTAAGLSYALLDAGGITLIEAKIDKDGEHHLLQARGELKNSELPVYLSTAFYRLYGLEPGEKPCSETGLNWFCLEQYEADSWKKDAGFGPFTLWTAEGKQLVKGEAEELHYEQPWGGVIITLKRLNR